jgi:hypothetical protein
VSVSIAPLHAAVFGLVTVARVPSTPELAHGELKGFLAEAAWYPTALLPSQGVHWEPIDDASARATLADGAVRASLDFYFDRDGLIATVCAPSRHRMVDGALQTARGRVASGTTRSTQAYGFRWKPKWSGNCRTGRCLTGAGALLTSNMSSRARAGACHSAAPSAGLR